MTESKADEKSPDQHLSAALQDFADKDPIVISVKCPEEKDFNPITKRCVKKCKEGYERNEKFHKFTKCRKTKKMKSVRTKSVKICSSDKEFNPITNRCVKKCKEGFLRNDKFKCYSVTKKRVKTIKHPLMSKSKSNRTRSRGRK
jgi:hypothetical protein